MSNTTPPARRPINAHMKIGVISGALFLFISQAILIFSVASNTHNGLLIEIGMACNFAIISSVIVLVIGVLERRFGK